MENMKVLKQVIEDQYEISKIKYPKFGKDLKRLSAEYDKNKLNGLKFMTKLFPPILGKWYQMHFTSPQSYFSARDQYIKSTAIMSIVGYLFGLGDRHLENIMVDLKTGAIAHIDFNCVFYNNERLP